MGYYAGLIVSNEYLTCVLLCTSTGLATLGITLLCNRSAHCPSMESIIRPCRSKTSVIDWPTRIVSVNAVLRAFAHFLAFNSEVDLAEHNLP